MIAVLIRRFANRAGSSNKSVGKISLSLRVIKLFDRFLYNQTRFIHGLPELTAKLAVFVTVRAAVVVEFDLEAGKVALMLFVRPRDELFFRHAMLLGTDHDRSAVGVVGAKVNAVVSAQLLKADPDIGLNVFNQVANVNRTVGIG